METVLLKDPQVLPTPEVLSGALGSSYPAYEELVATAGSPSYAIDVNWNYYNDGKAWLCKMVHKKKTVFWLSVWEGFFRTTFYFTEKNCTGIFDLGIDPSIIDDFNSHEPIGKLLPLVVEVREKAQLPDLLKIIDYKKRLK